MTIIAIFATISESSAALSLPFLGDDEREIYMWFLISFPFYLLFLFFITLNFNYRSLYAPSDFNKDKSFVRVIDNADRPESEKHPNSQKLAAKLRGSLNTAGSERSPPEVSIRFRGDRGADNPAQIDFQTIAQAHHSVQLPWPLKDLGIIDIRGIKTRMDVTAQMKKIHPPTGDTTKVIVFLACCESEKLLKACVLKCSRQKKKGACPIFCIVYNLTSQGVTVVDRL